MQSQNDIHVLLQLTMDREAQLRASSVLGGRIRTRRPLRRWAGRQLVRLGAWVAAEPAMQPARGT